MSLTETIQELITHMPGVRANRILQLSVSLNRFNFESHPEYDLYLKLLGYLEGDGNPPANCGTNGARAYRLLAQRMVDMNAWEKNVLELLPVNARQTANR